MSDILNDLRKNIDDIDNQLIKLISERFKLTKQVGLYKLQSKDFILQPGRWEQVLANLRIKATKYNLPSEMLIDIWNKIHEESLKQQEGIQNNAKKQ